MPTRPTRIRAERARLRQEDSSARLLGELRVLLVDDDRVDRMAARRALERSELLLEIVEADRQEEALRALLEHEFDCVLLDFRLPDGDAFKVIQRLEETKTDPPVIILTRHGSESVAVDLLKAGAIDYLSKSELTPSRISHCIKNALRLKRAEEALERAHADLERRVEKRTRELAAANRRLQREMLERQQAEAKARRHLDQLTHLDRVRTLGEMAAMLAHELHQPLGAISNFARGCRRKIDSGKADLGEIALILDKIAMQSERAADIVRRERSFGSRHETLQRYPVDVNGLVREIAELFRVGAQPHDVELRFDLAEGLPAVPADSIEIQQVLLNLLRNGLEAMRETPRDQRRIVIRTAFPESARQAKDRIEIGVADRGCGFPDGDLEQVFSSFFSTKEKSMGLGLTICRSIVEAHGGTLSARSNGESAGLEFYFDLPVKMSVGAPRKDIP